jgi:hypothetical protein
MAGSSSHASTVCKSNDHVTFLLLQFSDNSNVLKGEQARYPCAYRRTANRCG